MQERDDVGYMGSGAGVGSRVRCGTCARALAWPAGSLAGVRKALRIGGMAVLGCLSCRFGVSEAGAIQVSGCFGEM